MPDNIGQTSPVQYNPNMKKDDPPPMPYGGMGGMMPYDDFHDFDGHHHHIHHHFHHHFFHQGFFPFPFIFGGTPFGR